MSRKSIRVDLEQPYEVVVGESVLALAAESTRQMGGVVLVCDEHVEAFHAARLAGLEHAPRVRVPRGEAAKEFAVLQHTLERFATLGLERHSVVVALGGGATCDVAALAASLYMRGVAVVLCPTTLLAQVDASVGGKTAINLTAGKNLIGTFHQPRAVYVDTATLATLDDAEYRSGLGEVVKTALIAGPALFERIEASVDALLARDRDVLTDTVASCVRVKARFVVDDERERGPRKVLNLGHTFAHAIEQVAGFGRIPHGVAVATGIVLAIETSRACGVLRDNGLHERCVQLLTRLSLPASLAELRRRSGCALPAQQLIAAMGIDKKSRAAEPRFVLPRALGAFELDVRVDSASLIERLR